VANPKNKKIAIIGGGWAGCAAGVELSGKAQVVLFEAAHVLGGRARRILVNDLLLDNGQHILLGAYSESLRLMRQVGIDTKKAFLRLPLQMCYPPGSGGINFTASRLPAPLHLLLALWRTRGLAWRDKIALVRFMTTARWMEWELHQDCSVLELLERFDQTRRLYRLLWRPLCIAALNTLPESASAKVFLSILKDSIGSSRSASDMLIPLLDLSGLFPEAAAEYIRQRGGEIRLNHTVREIRHKDNAWEVQGEKFDGIVLATSAIQAGILAQQYINVSLLKSLQHEPVTTCYLQYAPCVRLERPFFALHDDSTQGKWGQFVFDRGHLYREQAGLLAVVISVASQTQSLDRNLLAHLIAKQLAVEFNRTELENPAWTSVISENNATFACFPNLARPDSQTEWKHFVLAGDYLVKDYPGTLESAVRSGVHAANTLALSASFGTGQ